MGRGVAVTIPVSVWVSAAVLAGVFVSVSRLGALLDRVSPLCGGWSLPRLDSSYLVDLDISFWRMLNVDVDQGWVERCWLIGQWESVHGMGWRFWFLVVPVALRGGSGRRRDWQVTKPSC